MNKTRKNKYLRKNRRISKKNKNKNKNKKIRKVQSGGEPGNTAVDTGRNLLALGTGAPITQNQPTLSSLTVKGENVQPLKTLTREELIEKEQAFIKQQRAFRTKQIAAAKEEAEATAAAAAEKAAGSRNIAEAAKEDEEQAAEAAAAAAAAEAAHFGQFGQSGRPYNNTRHEVVGPIDDTATSTAVTTTSPLSADHAPDAVTTAKPTASPPASTENVYDPKMSPDEEVAYFTQNALKHNKSLEEPDRRITLPANSFFNAIWGKLGSIGSDSQKKLADGEVLTEFIGDLSEIIKDSEDRVAIIREYNRLLTKEITDIYNKTGKNGTLTEEHKGHIHDLLGDITKNDEAIKRLRIEPSQLLHAMQTGNIAVLESEFGTQSQFGSQSRMLGNGSSKPNKGIFSRNNKGNSVTPGTPPGTPTVKPRGRPTVKPPGRPVYASKKVGILNRFVKKISGSLTRKKLTPEQEAERLKAVEQAKADQRETLQKEKDLNLTRKTLFFDSGKTGKKPNKSNIFKTPTRPPPATAGPPATARPPSKPLPPLPQEQPPLPPPPPPRTPPSLPPPRQTTTPAAPAPAPLPQQNNTRSTEKEADAQPPATQPDDDWDNDDNKMSFEKLNKIKIKPIDLTAKPEPVPTAVPMLSPPPQQGPPRILARNENMIKLGGGGNKTRKNRQHQYIHEVKDNRTHLFNKEMEILNSIRNFKNGHIDNDNTKKQFMKAVKRG